MWLGCTFAILSSAHYRLSSLRRSDVAITSMPMPITCHVFLKHDSHTMDGLRLDNGEREWEVNCRFYRAKCENVCYYEYDPASLAVWLGRTHVGPSKNRCQLATPNRTVPSTSSPVLVRLFHLVLAMTCHSHCKRRATRSILGFVGWMARNREVQMYPWLG